MTLTTVLVNLTILSVPLSAIAQGIPPLLEIERAEGTINVVIRNVGAARMTACALTYSQVLQQNGRQHEVGGRNIYDAVTNHNQIVPPGGTHTVKLVPRDAAADPNVQIRAGIYEDGSTFGDPGWVDLIRKRRFDFLEASINALEDLSTVTSNSMSSSNPAAVMETALSKRMAALGDEAQKAQAEAKGFSSGQSPYGGNTPAERSAKLAVLAAQEHVTAVKAIYSMVIYNLKIPPTSNGIPVDFAQTLNILRTKLTQEISRMKSQ